MLYGSETWCLVQNEIWILQRTERAMLNSMCGLNLMDKKLTKDIMEILDLNTIQLTFLHQDRIITDRMRLQIPNA